MTIQPNLALAPVQPTAEPTGAHALAQAAGTAPAAEKDPEDGFFRGVAREAGRTAVRWGNATGTILGGAIGLSVVGAGLYAGVAGGALFLGAIGMPLGNVVAAVSSRGLLNFIATSFRTAGFMARTGMVLGGAAGAVGGWTLGGKVGRALGTVPGAAAGAVAGTLTGVWHQIEKGAE